MPWTPLQQLNPWRWLSRKKIDPESAAARIHHEFCGRSRIYLGFRAFIVVIALAAVLTRVPEGRAQTPGPPQARELIIGTKVAPPFAMKAEDGTWRGISIDLWRHVADQIHLRYRFQETTLKGLTDGLAAGSLDVAVAALTVTGPRQRIIDFTQPFYSSGLGIAVATDAGISWWPIIRNVFSVGFFRAAAVLVAASLSIGVIL